jgi:predicted nucleotidyltransferase component of viral defense system
MIPKAQILEFARSYELLPTTIEKDYVLGWLLAGLSQHSVLSNWAFKGGTCLKKCFFETYRFSEDLDFTVPRNEPLSAESITTGLREVLTWVEAHTGIQFPSDRFDLEQYTNPRGNESFQAKIAYLGPLNLPRQSLQRVKFDLTQDELLADHTDLRELFHPYCDAPTPTPRVRCYSVNEILAEKARALYERSGRARDVYDIVHLSRDFREAIDPRRAAGLATQKFRFKELPPPTVDLILARVESGTLRSDWEQQLRHQVPHLPVVDSFLGDLRGALAWWLEPEHAPIELAAIPSPATEHPVPRQYFPAASTGGRGLLQSRLPSQPLGDPLERIRFAARNRLCAEILYHGVVRIVEPYSLRHRSTGNTLLYGFELVRGGRPSHGIKAFKITEVQAARITDRPFTPRFLVQL